MPEWTPAFLADLAFVLAREGGYVDNPRDPGGATNAGITQRVDDAWRRRQGQPVQSVRQITPEEVRAIYWTEYYQPATDGVPGPLTLIVFDTAVNMGVGRARRFLVASGRNPERYLALRRQEYHHIVAAHPVLQEFLPGWLYRLRALRKAVPLPPDPALEADFHAARTAQAA